MNLPVIYEAGALPNVIKNEKRKKKNHDCWYEKYNNNNHHHLLLLSVPMYLFMKIASRSQSAFLFLCCFCLDVFFGSIPFSQPLERVLTVITIVPWSA
jgi:hypothetical protein